MASAVNLSSSSRGGPLLPSMIVAALVPALCVLWFMSAAIRNEQLAAEQRLTGLYSNQLVTVQRRLDEFWTQQAARLQSLTLLAPAEAFAAIVRSNWADSVVILNDQGQPVYPTLPQLTSLAAREIHPDWTQARQLEFQERDYPAAAEIYSRIRQSRAVSEEGVAAAQAEARCRLKADQYDHAAATLCGLLQSLPSAYPVDPFTAQARAQAQLKLLQLPEDSEPVQHERTLTELAASLNDYALPIPSSQRLFLMEQLETLFTRAVAFPTLDAERLGVGFLETSPSYSSPGQLSESPLSGVGQLLSLNRTVNALFRYDRLRERLGSIIAGDITLPDGRVTLLAPGESPDPAAPVPMLSAGQALPGWRLQLVFEGSDPFVEASRQQARRYGWSGLIAVVVMILVSGLLSRTISAQLRLARIKDELVSTVSHELKTPLANIRALVDTMLAGRTQSPDQQRAYLELIAGEGQRLTHLIDNFLAFSRLTHGRTQFRLAPLDPNTLVHSVAEKARRRFQPHPVNFVLQVPSVLPTLVADEEALTSVLLNLLDNAYKYTGEDKQIELRAWMQDHHCFFEVVDNGIGLSPSERRRIFDRFYQANQGLARRQGGCGLGLSIVQSIVQAHGGTVEVTSQPGAGSRFRVILPLTPREPEGEPLGPIRRYSD